MNIAKIEGVGISTVMRLKKEFCGWFRITLLFREPLCYFLIIEEIIFQKSIDCKKMFIFAMLVGRNPLTQESILF